MLSVIKTQKIWFSISSFLVAGSFVAIFAFGLPYGIDFTGGSLIEFQVESGEFTKDTIKKVYQDNSFDPPVIQSTGETGIIVRMEPVDEEKHQSILGALVTTAEENGAIIKEVRFESIGPSIGEELAKKSIKALIGVLLAIVLYISWVFRKVSKPVASWKYGVIALITLFHDVIIVVGFFALAGYFFDWQINTPFIAALLTVLGYSVNDTIIIFDRVRENIRKASNTYEETIDVSVKQSITRSVNTSITTLIVLFSIFFFGGESIKSFVLALIIGIVSGTYSSIFLASPLLGAWFKYQNR